MKKFNFFPVVMMGVLILAAVMAVLIFSGFLPGFKNKGGNKGPAVNLTMWGTLPGEKISPVVSALNRENEDSFSVKYYQKSPKSYERELVEALASGKGPDFMIAAQDEILKIKDKIFTIPFTSYPQRTFLDNFINTGELFLDDEGALGIPFLIDPLVLYWNKDMFASVGVSQPPKDWDEFVRQSASFTEKNDAGNIERTGAALGEFTNITNAKDILAMMMLQAGEPIVKKSSRGELRASLEAGKKNESSSAESSVKFFNEFSNPGKDNYSWNKALPEAGAMFARGALAMYFGYAGEYETVRSKNPHLDFDIAGVPQMKNGGEKITFARTYALAILKNSSKKQQSFSAIAKLTGKQASEKFSAVGLASARRDSLAETADNAYFAVVNKAAVMSGAWLDPDKEQTTDIFKDMAESSASGAATVSSAVQTAKRRLDQLLKNLNK